MAKKQKYYVVWVGRQTGVFDSWAACEAQVSGFDGAKFKAYPTRDQATKALELGSLAKANAVLEKATTTQGTTHHKAGSPIVHSIAVDAAWNTATGDMEYQGVVVGTGQRVFKSVVYEDGTNNIGEFLAIVHALAWLKQQNLNTPIYSDSKTALAWVRKRKANTKLTPTTRNGVLFELIERAELWLQQNTFENPLLKWETAIWGENPADFGRK
ncbi:MAG TPA: ribonuclease H [Microscillaceae bacterium]|nr:ribonuclease H [Microscillaceae bacterium]